MDAILEYHFNSCMGLYIYDADMNRVCIVCKLETEKYLVAIKATIQYCTDVIQVAAALTSWLSNESQSSTYTYDYNSTSERKLYVYKKTLHTSIECSKGKLKTLSLAAVINKYDKKQICDICMNQSRDLAYLIYLNTHMRRTY